MSPKQPVISIYRNNRKLETPLHPDIFMGGFELSTDVRLCIGLGLCAKPRKPSRESKRLQSKEDAFKTWEIGLTAFCWLLGKVDLTIRIMPI